MSGLKALDVDLSEDAERVCYAVGRYDRAGAKSALLDCGAAEADAKAETALVPDGFPFVFDVETGEPLHAVTAYLLRSWSRPKAGLQGTRSLNTARAQAYDICQFLEHLDHYGRDFSAIDQAIVDKFAENQSRVASLRTGLTLSASSIRRRVVHVRGFLESPEFRTIGSSNVNGKLVPIGGRVAAPTIHPLTPAEWEVVAEQLGPLPSEARQGETSVARLVAEWSLLTGARRVEVLGLTRSMLEPINRAASSSGQSAVVLRLIKTKGGVPRNLWVHPDLVKETEIYLKNERRRALAGRSAQAEEALFVYPAVSPRHGAPVQAEAASRWFRSAVDKARLQRRTIDGSASARRFVFHDLRHTYAVWTYVALQRSGVQRPWKIIQARLGHRLLETTERYYLSFIEDHEQEISDLLKNRFDSWIISDED